MVIFLIAALMYISTDTVEHHKYCESIEYKNELCKKPIRIELHDGTIINKEIK